MMSLNFLAKVTTWKYNMNFITKFIHIVKIEFPNAAYAEDIALMKSNGTDLSL